MVTGLLVAKPWWVASSMAAPCALPWVLRRWGEGVEIVDVEAAGGARAGEVELPSGGVCGEVVPATLSSELVDGEDLVWAGGLGGERTGRAAAREAMERITERQRQEIMMRLSVYDRWL